MKLFLLLLIFLAGCSSEAPLPREVIWGRSSGAPPLYRAEVPASWEKLPREEGLEDTTRPIASYLIREGAQAIRIAVHNFPAYEKQQRIPPQANLARWRGQFEELKESHWAVKACSRGGFCGLMLDASGKLRGEEARLLAWSMQMAERPWNALQLRGFSEKGADYTIKASGPLSLMNKHAPQIERFAETFELIEELPGL